MSCTGISWGLPSRKIDPFLFGGAEAWSGEKIFQLARAGEKLSSANMSSLGADVDVNPLIPRANEPALLTGTDEDIAKIYLRYRLYTYQPDEMITMMALAGMRPGDLQFDPRLYQYGGLFIYPVGVLIKFCGILGLIDVRSDLVYYLDNPDEFGKFYVVARSYSAAWGLLGVLLVFGLTRRMAAAIQIGSEVRTCSADLAGLIAALLFTLMPVVVCMSHEGKPHLPGAVLMLLAVYLAIRSVELSRPSAIDNRKYFWFTCVCCGGAVGMVLSSWPICVLIPLVAFFQDRRSMIDDRGTKEEWQSAAKKSLLGGIIALGIYFATNPYVLINCFVNRVVLRSNFGNSLAMYEVSRLREGFVRVLELTMEGATFPLMLVGVIALIIGLATRIRRCRSFWVLIVPAAMFFTQFVLIGAGKPPEYGRFGIFTNTALAIGAAALLCGRWFTCIWGVRTLLPLLLLVWTGYFGLSYLRDFQKDSSGEGTRMVMAREIRDGQYGPKQQLEFALLAEPAPYSCPPLPFNSTNVWLLPDVTSTFPDLRKPLLFIRPWDQSIGWADKFFVTTRWMGSGR